MQPGAFQTNIWLAAHFAPARCAAVVYDGAFRRLFVSSRKKGKVSKKNKQIEQPTFNAKWIPYQTGIMLIAVTSIGLAVFTAWQLIPALGWLEGSLYALLFGGMIWVVFFVMKVFYRFMQR
jgi:hypothetical protein